jgi:hypothetical protein
MISQIALSLFNLGIRNGQPISVSHRLRVNNKFCLLCIAYTIPFIIYCFLNSYVAATMLFVGCQLFLIGALLLNARGSYLASRMLIVITTNFSVFYLSRFFGFDSGFHLYYFSSPLIVAALFGSEERKSIIVSMLIYFGSLIYLLVQNNFYTIDYMYSPGTTLYTVNVILSLSFCTVLALSYTSFSRKMNKELLMSNRFLSEEKERLITEIEARVEQAYREEKLKREISQFRTVTHGIIKRKLGLMLHLMEANEDFSPIVDDPRARRYKALQFIDRSLKSADDLNCIDIPGYLEELIKVFENSIRITANIKESKRVNGLTGFSLAIVLFETIDLVNDLQLSVRSEIRINYGYQEGFHFFKIIVSPAIDLQTLFDLNMETSNLIQTYVTQISAGFTVARDTIQLTVGDNVEV